MKLTFFQTLGIIFVLATGCKPNQTLPPQPPFLLEENQNRTPTYEEGIAFWKSMDSFYEEVSLFEFGMTDAGFPIHVVVVSKNKWRSLEEVNQSTKNKLLINNAIHPGEPDGVDASMLLVHQLLTENKGLENELDKTDIFIIPFYNIGGALNRNSSSRANQNGPEEYGFRGNAQYLDLNRDFVKSDSKNARSFAKLIQLIDPDLYIETHVSNGADYQHVITYLSTQQEKLGGDLGEVLKTKATPFLMGKMSERGYDMVPYVNVHNRPPDEGYETFYDQPRYSTGYLTLHGIPGYITETHMLKPYKDRVDATWNFLQVSLQLISNVDFGTIKKSHRASTSTQKTFAIDWEVDTTHVDSIMFKGYGFGYKPSEISGSPRLYYDRNLPFARMIPFRSRMIPTKIVSAPKYYILQRGFVDLEDRLKENGIKMIEVLKDTMISVEVYAIDSFGTYPKPYEKHYMHHHVKIISKNELIKIKKGDWMIPLDDYKKRFIVELLEPESPDSYFNWNYFDGVLQQKEWYSAYVFEDEAAAMLKNNASIRAEFEMQKLDTSFANNPQNQLYWLYQQSPRFESGFMRYPIFRVMD